MHPGRVVDATPDPPANSSQAISTIRSPATHGPLCGPRPGASRRPRPVPWPRTATPRSTGRAAAGPRSPEHATAPC